MWTLGAALDLVREIEPRLAASGWHVALAGGVMLRGSSEHDLDLVVFPHDSTRADYCELRSALHTLGWLMHLGATRMRAGWALKGSSDRKHVEVWRLADGRRVDVIAPSE